MPAAPFLFAAAADPRVIEELYWESALLTGVVGFCLHKLVSSDFLLHLQINLFQCSILFQKSPVSLVCGQHSTQVFSDALVLLICFPLFQLNFWKEKLST